MTVVICYEFERCYVLLIQPTAEPCAGKVWLTNDPHFTFGLDAICSEFLPDERIPNLPPGGRFISKIKLHKTPSHYQIFYISFIYTSSLLETISTFMWVMSLSDNSEQFSVAGSEHDIYEYTVPMM
jgi:hypothetical protein